MTVVWSSTLEFRCQMYPARTSEQPSLGIALLSPNGEGNIKVFLKKSCPQSDLSSNRGGLVIQYCGRNDTINICTWNMRTLQDNDKQLERRTAIIGRELAGYNITIAALSETRLPDESQLEEKGAGYTFFWIGKPASDHQQAGVGFAIRTSYVCHIDTPPKGITERLMSMRIILSGKNYATIVSAYAPTMTYPDEDKINNVSTKV